MSLKEGMPHVRFAHRFLSSDPVPAHEHECPELVLVTRGVCDIQIGKNILRGRRGDVFLLPARVPHDQVATGMVGTLYIGFDPGVEPTGEMPQVIPAAHDRYVHEWVKTIIDLHRLPDTPSSLIGGMMTALLARLRQRQGQLANPASRHPKVDAAIDYIRPRLDQPLSITRIARTIGVSPSHLRTLFRQHMGVSPRRYQKSLRMSLALRRLSDPYPSIKEIAAECGYRDVNLFIRLFRKHHGVSPGRWRKRDVARAGTGAVT